MDEFNPRYAIRKSNSKLSMERVLWYLRLLCIANLDVLPAEFDTPMFWNEEELAYLKGTEVLPRIGRQKSEEQYTKILLPIIKANPKLFNLEKCGLSEFHRMGSLVLAYSFGKSDDEEDDGDSTKNYISMVPLADMLNANPQLNNVLSKPYVNLL
jgi:N-lysine methyltransferase SETD6